MLMLKKFFFLIIIISQCSFFIVHCYAQKPEIYLTGGANPLCDTTKLDWATWTVVNDSVAQGNITSDLKIKVTQSPNDLYSTPRFFQGNNFPAQYNIPIDSTTININLPGGGLGMFTSMCFSKPILNPQIALEYSGRPMNTINFITSSCYRIIWQGLGGVTYPNDTTVVIVEGGVTIIKFPGVHTCISLNFHSEKYYCSLAVGIPDTNCQKLPAICTGNSASLTANGAINYSWSPSEGLNTTTGSVVIATPSITTTYTVTGTGVNNPCTYIANNNFSTDSIIVTVNPLPTIAVNPIPAMICPDNSVTLTASGANTYSWSPATGLNSNSGKSVIATPVSLTTTYTVSGIDSNGCINYNTVSVNEDTLHVNLGKDDTICSGLTITLDAGISPATYTWNDNSHNKTLQVKNAGKYSVTATDTNGCSSSACVNIFQYPLSTTTNIVKDTTICDGCSILLNAGNGFKEYKWQDGSTASTYTVNNSGKYWVILTDQNGCKHTDTIIVNPECEGRDLFVPNAFTPNGKINKIFKVVFQPCFTNFDMKIYNRWGEFLFETTDINEGWDGKFKNNECPEAVYVYVITYYNITNKFLKLRKNGTVTLLR